MAWITRWANNPKLRFLVIRRNSDDLNDWIDRAKQMWRGLNVEITRSPREARFPSGAKGVFGHLHDDEAYTKYQGHEYQKMIIEELTHIPTEDLYLKLLGSNRSTVSELKPQVFCTTNPGNAGHEWVRKRFVAPAEPNTPFEGEQGNSRIFIPARVEDNPTLVDKDPDYVKYLESLPENLRKQWREGSWEELEIEGSYYGKNFSELKEKGQISSVPYDENTTVHTAWDLGMDDATAIWFIQMVGREIHVVDHEEGSGKSLVDWAKILKDKPYQYGKTLLPHDAKARELGTGRTRVETLENLGFDDIEVAPRQSVDDGIHMVRTLLPRCWFDAVSCEQGIQAMKQYRKEWDDKRATYKNRPLHDWSSHSADAFRTFALLYDKIGSRNQSGLVRRYGY